MEATCSDIRRQQRSWWRLRRQSPCWLLLLYALLSLACATPRSRWSPLAPCDGLSMLGPHCAPSNTSVRVGVFHCPSPNLVVCAIPRIDLIIDIWAKHVNHARCGLLGRGIGVQLVPRALSGSAANVSEISAAVASMLAERGGVDFVVLPPGSNWHAAMRLLEERAVPSVAPLSPHSGLYQCTGGPSPTQPDCVDTNTRRFQYAHSISSPGELYFREWIGLLQLKRVRSLIPVSTNLPLYDTVIAGLSVSAADAQIEILTTSFLNLALLPNSNSVPPQTVERVVDQLVLLDADAVVILASDCKPWIHRLRLVDYLPKSLATLLCTDSVAALSELGPDLNYIVGPSQWDPFLSGGEYEETNLTAPYGSMFPSPPGDPGFIVGDGGDVVLGGDALPAYYDASGHALVDVGGGGSGGGGTHNFVQVIQEESQSSPLKFVARYQQALNYSTSVLPGYDSASILAAFSMLEGAIESAGSTDASLVNRALQLYFAPSFFGLLTTDRYGMNQQKQLPILQRSSDQSLRIIAPSQFSTMDFIYPMPAWHDRVYTHAMYALPVEQVVAALAAGCVAFTLALCAYLFRHRRQQVFQAGGVWFYMCMGGGCVASYLALLTWPVENNSATCAARIWVWTLSFQAFVAPMVACALRIARIHTQGLASVRVSNGQVAVYCLAIAAPQLLLDILWVSIAPLRARVVQLDPLRPARNYTVCEHDSTLGTNLFGALTLLYSALLLLSACMLAWHVRKAVALFNDAKPIALSMYIFSIMSVVVLVVQLALNSPDIATQKMLFGLRSCGVLIAYQSSLAILFLRRILNQLDMAQHSNVLQTAIGTDFGEHSPHLRTEISEVVWRNDQKQKASAMLRAAAAASGDAGAGHKHAHANRQGEARGDPAGLFSRGDSSAPPTPVMLPFRSLAHHTGAGGAGGGGTPAVAAGGTDGSVITLAVHRPGLGPPAAATAYPGANDAANPHAHVAIPDPGVPMRSPTDGDGDADGQQQQPHHRAHSRPAYTHAHLYPGQAMTQSALGDQRGPARTGGDDGGGGDGTGTGTGAGARPRPPLPDTPNTSVFEGVMLRTIRTAAQPGTAAPTAATGAALLQAQSATDLASSSSSSSSSSSGGTVFPLPPPTTLRSMHPSHFFSWREQVRQHIALLQLQHAMQEPLGLQQQAQQQTQAASSARRMSAGPGVVQAQDGGRAPAAVVAARSSPSDASEAVLAVAPPQESVGTGAAPPTVAHEASLAPAQPDASARPHSSGGSSNGHGIGTALLLRRVVSPEPDVCSRSMRPSLAHMASLGALELHVLSPRSPSPSDLKRDDDDAEAESEAPAHNTADAHGVAATASPSPAVLPANPYALSARPPLARLPSNTLVPQRPVAIALLQQAQTQAAGTNTDPNPSRKM